MNYQKVYMNQIYSSTLLGQLAHMWKNQLLCDAIIRTGQVTTKAHRVVLVAACPMLQSMENASSGSHLEVRLAADIKQDAVNTFLQYLYEGYMMLTEENCRDVEKVARLLQVDNVCKCCSDFYKCMQSKTGLNVGGSQYKYSGQDTTDFKHVRATELQKTVHERMMKRTSEFNRPGSPGGKRQRVHRGGSPDVTVIGLERADDTASMAHSYMSSAPDPWDRVPRLGSGSSSKSASGKSQPGVIDIVEESLELVQTEPQDKDSGQVGSRPSDSRTPQKTSMSISVASQFNTDPEISIVNVTGSKDQGSTSNTAITTSTSSQPARGSITVSPLTIFNDSQQPSRELAGSSSSSSRQESQRQSEPQMYIQQRPVDHSTPQRSSFPTVNQSKPFAAGSAVQASSSPASSGTPPIGSPAAHKSRVPPRPDSSGGDEKGKDQRPKSVDTQDIIPDLSIVKVEANVLEDTGGLDMHVDMPEAGMMQMHHGRLSQGEEQEEPSDTEIEDWAREEMSNEGSNISGDQNNSWYMGTFKDPVTSTGRKSMENLIKSKKADHSHNMGQGHLSLVENTYVSPMDSIQLAALNPEEQIALQQQGLYAVKPGQITLGYSYHGTTCQGPSLKIAHSDVDISEHDTVHIEGRKAKPCVYCVISKTKTKSGWYPYTYYKCGKCDVPLCMPRSKRECFVKYHQFCQR